MEGKSKAVPLSPGGVAHSLDQPSTAQSPSKPDALTQFGNCHQNLSSKGAAAREMSWPQLSGSLRLLPVLGREGGSRPWGKATGHPPIVELSFQGRSFLAQHTPGSCLHHPESSLQNFPATEWEQPRKHLQPAGFRGRAEPTGVFESEPGRLPCLLTCSGTR